ncbi:MAG: hypothetical protein HYX76_14320 [Acidobacteria bacterium]|nr:hypothetical protein [Acidobacteriota bacterium]
MRIAILYEHPEWFLPLFDTLDARGLQYELIDASSLDWDPAKRPGFDLLVNRMSPSAHTRGHGHAIQAAVAYLAYVERFGIPVINGLAAYRLELSKSAQADLFERLAVRYPRTRVINSPGAAVRAAEALRFPVIVKPNIGGSGAGIRRFDTPAALAAAIDANHLGLGIDDTALVQEFLPARDGAITRIELIDGEFLYAIRIAAPPGHGFNLCPADICQDDNSEEAEAGMCPIKPAMQIEPTNVPPNVLRDAKGIAETAGLDICGIEVLVNERDGQYYFYDVNALSNFVTDATRVVGFDPFERFVDYIEERLAGAGAATLEQV